MNNRFITIPGSIRSKKNSKQIIMVGGKNCQRRPIMIPSKAHKRWEDEARKYLWTIAIVPPLTCPVWIEAHFFIKGPLPDLSGACESLGDCLEGILYVADAQIYSWDWSRVHRDKENPRTEVILRWNENVL